MFSSYDKRRSAEASGYAHLSDCANYGVAAVSGYAHGAATVAAGGYAHGPCRAGTGDARTRPLRVVHLGPCFVQGGAEQQAIDLARALDPSRARIEMFLVTNPELISPAKAAQVAVPVQVADADMIRQAAHEFDIMLFWGIELDRYLAGVPRSARTVCIAHGVGEWVNTQLRGSLGSTDQVVAVSEMVRESLTCSLPTTAIPNGIDAKRIAAARPRREVRRALGFAPTDFVTGFVGRFSPEKQPELVIEAVSRLPAPHKGLLVGYGQLEHELMRLANRRIPGRFAFAFADDYLGDYYQAMDCFCLPSPSEGFALVLLEAMMSGKPVVSTDVGGARELIRHRQTGVIVDADPECIAAAIHDIASSPDWARGMAAAAAQRADEVGHASQMARRYEELFAALCPVDTVHGPPGGMAPTYAGNSPPAPALTKTESIGGLK